MTRTALRRLEWDEIQVGAALPDLVLPITYLRAASHPAGTRDYFPGHHDPGYAKSQGQPDLYVNTMFLHGVLDRIVLDWAGPAWFISRRKMTMMKSIYVHDVLTACGVVTAKSPTDGDLSVTVGIRVLTSAGLCVTGDSDIAPTPPLRLP